MHWKSGMWFQISQTPKSLPDQLGLFEINQFISVKYWMQLNGLISRREFEWGNWNDDWQLSVRLRAYRNRNFYSLSENLWMASFTQKRSITFGIFMSIIWNRFWVCRLWLGDFISLYRHERACFIHERSMESSLWVLELNQVHIESRTPTSIRVALLFSISSDVSRWMGRNRMFLWLFDYIVCSATM